ncbi:hypothetical protein D9757_004805 [Collybiopsis confluens]|uniref:Malic acid transport protein n=1 Tax=Collybiopsis confluens TaxID=2823264 RepID=A0A8H5HSK1_9AGAR|nr:hypothetical protein D9757_004805 [Collybiopsis confluens]
MLGSYNRLNTSAFHFSICLKISSFEVPECGLSHSLPIDSFIGSPLSLILPRPRSLNIVQHRLFLMVRSEATSQPRVSALAKRVHGWSWQAFPIGMGTGAVYVTLSGITARSPTLTLVETVFYFLNMSLFLLNTLTLLTQAIVYPRQAWRLLNDPVKGIFVPLVVLSFATIIIGTINYAVPPGHVSPEFIYALFWHGLCWVRMLDLFSNADDLVQPTSRPDSFHSGICIFSISDGQSNMLVGVISFNVLRTMSPEDTRAVGVLVAGYFFQGIGFFMTFFYLCIYIIRIMTTGFLDGHQANGAFVACGPPGFTALALLKLGDRARIILPAHGLISPTAGEIWYASSAMAALMLYGLAVFFFVFGILPYWFKLHKHLHEILGCWALTFPNVGWISTTRVLADLFHIPGFTYIHFAMAVLMCATWAILFVLTVIAFWKGLIFCSEDEDVLKDMKDSSTHTTPMHEAKPSTTNNMV